MTLFALFYTIAKWVVVIVVASAFCILAGVGIALYDMKAGE